MTKAVILMVVYIYIYIYISRILQNNTVERELHSKNKECGGECCKPVCDIFPKSSTYRKANVRI